MSKITLNVTFKDIVTERNGTKTISFGARNLKDWQVEEFVKEIETMANSNDLGLKMELSKYRKGRSINANNYLWELIDQISEIVKLPRIDVYKKFIKDVGVFEIVPIKAVAVDSYIEKWSKNGLGWFCEILGDSKIPGYKNIVTYFGSSSYDTKEMSRLIDEVVMEAKELGIETLDEKQLKEMKENGKVNTNK